MPVVGRRTGALPRASHLGWMALGAALGWCAPVGAQSFSPYSDFQALTQAELATLQVKLSYLGVQFKPIRTRIFSSPTNPVNPALFVPFQRPGFGYANDDSAIVTFTATVQELDQMIDSVGTLPGVTDGGVDASGFVSFALLKTAGGTKAFESIVDLANGRDLFARMRGALGANATARRRLEQMACELDMLPTTPPSEVSSSVAVTVTGVRLDRKTGQFVGRLRLTNNSGGTLPAPLSVVLDLKPNVRLVGETGFTCRITPRGRPYLNLSVGAGLAPGVSVEQLLRFDNPDLDLITLQTRVFAGLGTR